MLTSTSYFRLLAKHFQHRTFAPQPNWGFNADANTGHAFGIFMASVGALRALRSGVRLF